MNQKEWKKSGKFPGKYEWYNNTRKIQKSLTYNPDLNATVIHHLRYTEEQRKYNDEHYELWGFEIDENGNEHFEYGKYVIFLTKEEHSKIHACSEETRNKISKSNKGRIVTEETKKKLSESWTKERKLLYSLSHRGKNNNFYGGKFSESVLAKMSKSSKERWEDPQYRIHMHIVLTGRKMSEESKHKISEATRGENNPFYGKHHSDETKETIKQKSNAYWSLEESHIRQSEILKQHYKDNPVSDETKRKLSESLKGRIFSEDTINRIKYSRAHSTKVAEHNKNMQVCKEHYSLIKEYKSISWNNFQKLFKNDYYLLKAIIIILGHTNRSKNK